MKKIINLIKFQDKIGEPPWDYYFLQNLPESEYPKYLAKLFYLNTGEKLPLSHGVIDKRRCKTFNRKIQWLKLYGVSDLMRDCTDKVKVRDYVKEKIGEEYLKPVLQIIPNESHETVHCHCEQVNDNSGLARQSRDINSDKLDCRVAQIVDAPRNDRALIYKDNDSENNDVSNYFDQIHFDKLPNSFVIKTNHGCKWQYIVKNKNEFIKNKQLYETVKKNITGWLEQKYWIWGGFEMQYKNIEPKILIEPLMRDNIDKSCQEIQVYCFNGQPKLIIKLHNEKEITIYDENLEISKNNLGFEERKINIEADDLIKQSFVLSKQLSKDFIFVRTDWMIYQNKLYFEELTFTPYSGFNGFKQHKTKIKFGELIKIEGI